MAQATNIIATVKNANRLTITVGTRTVADFDRSGSAPWFSRAEWEANQSGFTRTKKGLDAFAFVGGDPNEWMDPADDTEADNYEIRFVEVSQSGSGTRVSPTLNSWFALTSSRAASIEKTNAGFADWVLDVSIRRIGTTTPVFTGRITLDLENTA